MAVGISSLELSVPAMSGEVTEVIQPAPLVVPDDGLYELVDGKIVEKEVGAQQAEIASILDQTIGSFARARRLGRALAETVFRIDQATDLQRRPDVAFVSDARWPFRKRLPAVSAWDMVPDLAIEVVSPNNSADEVQIKRLEFFRAGVKVVWVVYPRLREVHVYTSPTDVTILTAEQELDGGALLPGFRLPLSDLFDDEPDAE